MVDRYNNGKCMGYSSSRNNVSNAMNNKCGCGCGQDKDDCKKDLEKLRMVDFSMIDTILYLDAYPDCKAALDYYHKLKKQRCELVRELAEKCDMPITNFEHSNEQSWIWTKGPWPWEPCAN